MGYPRDLTLQEGVPPPPRPTELPAPGEGVCGSRLPLHPGAGGQKRTLLLSGCLGRPRSRELE